MLSHKFNLDMSESNSKLLRGINHVSDTCLGAAQLKFHSAEPGGQRPPSSLYIRREKKKVHTYICVCLRHTYINTQNTASSISVSYIKI